VSETRSWFLRIGGAIIGTLAAVAILAPVLAPYDPRAISGPSLAAPSSQHLLGTNDAGQDLLSQLVWGARSSALVALVAAAIAVIAGVLVGACAGLLRGVVDTVSMRVVDVFLAIPALPLLILVAALSGPSRATVIVVIGLAGWPAIARIVRSQALSLGRRGYLEAARGLAPVIVANFVNWASTAVVLQAGLAFLGLSDPTEVSWGGVLNRALAHEGIYFSSQWTWWVLPPGLAITAAAVGLAFLGLALEPRSNPRLRRA